MSLTRPLFLRPKVPSDSSSDDIMSSPSSGTDKPRKTQSRKNHTKSRTGCHNCKRRRIKCPENYPSCSHCVKRGLKCEWPDIQIFQSGLEEIGASSEAILTLQPSSPNKNFSMQDFRLFYKFTQDAYPHHPIGNDYVWTHDIPNIAHNHDYLMHSMLALSASELLEEEPTQELACTAIHHRIIAIKALNESISKGCLTCEDGNAMLATCYALIHQSSLIDDGICEFMSFTRGCVKVLWHMGRNMLPFIFKNVIVDAQLETMGPHLQGPPGLPKDIVDEAITAVQEIQHLCLTDGEKLMQKYILELVTGIAVSKRDAYIGLMHIYGCFCYEMTQSDFETFTRPDNEAGKLLQAYWVAAQSLLNDVTVHEQNGRARLKRENPNSGSMRWMKLLLRDINPSMREYYRWPIMQTHKVWRAQGTIGWIRNGEWAGLDAQSESVMAVEEK